MSGAAQTGTLNVFEQRPAADAAGPSVSTTMFEKRGRPEAIEREARVYERVHALSGGRPTLAPRPVAWDRSAGLLVLEALEGWSTLHELFARQEQRDVILAGELGACIARLHALDPGALAPAIDHVPRLELRPREAAGMSGAMLELIGMLQRAPKLQTVLDGLREERPPLSFVHGDMKLDNVLAHADGRLRIVDFEHAGVGDPAWDLGAAVGDYLSRWLLSARTSPGQRLAEWLREATVPQERCATAAGAVFAGYELKRPLPDRERIAACVGIFLLHRAQAWVERYGVLSAKPALLARCGARLVVRRGPALSALLGTDR